MFRLINDLDLNFLSVYRPPHVTATLQDWEHLFEQFKYKTLIGGDFNGHHLAWGCISTKPQGLRILQALENFDLMFFNDGTHTTISRPTCRSSAIDLTVASRDLINRSTWEVHGDALGSYHFPIKIKMTLNIKSGILRSTKRWKEEKADWTAFSNILSNFKLSDQGNSDNSTKYVNMAIKLEEACSSSMPEKKAFFPKIQRLIWWDEECSDIIRKRKDVLAKYKHNSSLENFIAYRNMEAYSKRALRQKSRESWRSYVNKLNKSTPITNVWKLVKSLVNKRVQTTPPLSDTLIQNDLDRLAPASVPNTFDNILLNT